MKPLKLILAGFLLAGYSYAQDIKWTEPEKSGGTLNYILPLGGGNFYATKTAGRGVFGTYQLAHYEDFHITAKEKVPYKVPSGSGSVERILIAGGKPVVFISDKSESLNRLYIQECDDMCSAVGSPKLIWEIPDPKGRKNGGEFSVLTSNNGEFVVVMSTVTDTKSGNQDVGYRVLDVTEDFSTFQEGHYSVNLEGESKELITAQYISDFGDYFQVVDGVTNTRRQKLQGRTLRLLTADGVEDMPLELPDGKYISNMEFSSDKEKLTTITGTYGNGSNGVAGIFYMQVDFRAKNVVREGFSEFDNDFITQGWSDRAKEKAEKRAAAGKGTPQLYEYEMRENITLPDGSIIGLLEQFYIRVVTSTTAQGSTTTTYYYYYNDVVAFKILPSGEFGWVKKIPKYQVSVNDGGVFSSFSNFVSDGKLTLIFNDVTTNYVDGAYVEPKVGSGKATKLSKRKNVVAKVDIDIVTGDSERNVFFSREETEAIAVPKKFNVDYKNGEVIMYLITGSKEKFGLMKI